MDTKHTPGPWHWVNPVTDEPRAPGEWRSSLRTVAEFGENKTEIREELSYTSFALPKFILEADEIMDDQMDANARLIAAAPELLEACLWLKEYAEVQVRSHPDASDTKKWQSLLTAITKATQP